MMFVELYDTLVVHGRLTQWESATFTRWKSLVQIQYRPLRRWYSDVENATNDRGPELPQGSGPRSFSPAVLYIGTTLIAASVAQNEVCREARRLRRDGLPKRASPKPDD